MHQGRALSTALCISVLVSWLHVLWLAATLHHVLLQSRGCPLRGLPATPTLEAHKQRYLTNSWEKADALDLDTIYKDYLDPAEKRRCVHIAV